MTSKKGSSSKRRVTKHHSSKRTAVRKAGSRAKKISTVGRRVSRKGKSRAVTSGITYLFECTREGCGYRIVREEKAEQGELRYDLKCPKCHNSEFRCLGQGDLPEAEKMELAIPMPTLDLDNIHPTELGSN